METLPAEWRGTGTGPAVPGSSDSTSSALGRVSLWKRNQRQNIRNQYGTKVNVWSLANSYLTVLRLLSGVHDLGNNQLTLISLRWIPTPIVRLRVVSVSYYYTCIEFSYSRMIGKLQRRDQHSVSRLSKKKSLYKDRTSVAEPIFCWQVSSNPQVPCLLKMRNKALLSTVRTLTLSCQ